MLTKETLRTIRENSLIIDYDYYKPGKKSLYYYVNEANDNEANDKNSKFFISSNKARKLNTLKNDLKNKDYTIFVFHYGEYSKEEFESLTTQYPHNFIYFDLIELFLNQDGLYRRLKDACLRYCGEDDDIRKTIKKINYDLSRERVQAIKLLVNHMFNCMDKDRISRYIFYSLIDNTFK